MFNQNQFGNPYNPYEGFVPQYQQTPDSQTQQAQFAQMERMFVTQPEGIAAVKAYYDALNSWHSSKFGNSSTPNQKTENEDQISKLNERISNLANQISQMKQQKENNA